MASLPERRIRWHLVTPEYPPAIGGVADHTCLLAQALARHGDEVHVWAPGDGGLSVEPTGVSIHRELGAFRHGQLRRAGALLSSGLGPRRLFVQWVPHGYGARSMNLSFCWWVLQRARCGDEVHLMVHEPFLAFREGSVSQDAAAAVHRLMMTVLLRAASQVWLSTEAWRRPLMAWTFGRRVPCDWLPIGSSLIPPRTRIDSPRQTWAKDGDMVVGHFGTHGGPVVRLLRDAMGPVLRRRPDVILVLIGAGSEGTRELWLKDEPHLAGQLHATGLQPAEQVSAAISAVDLLCQPYPDGVTCRRTSAMAALSLGIPLVTTHGHLTEGWWYENAAADVSSRADNERDLSSAICCLLGSESERRALAARGAFLYERDLSLDRAVDRLRSSS